MIRLPPGPLVWPILRITVLTWAVLRAFVGFAIGSPRILLPTSLLLMAGVAFVAVVDQAVARERIWMANLGVGRRVVAGTSALITAGLEASAGLLLRFLGV